MAGDLLFLKLRTQQWSLAWCPSVARQGMTTAYVFGFCPLPIVIDGNLLPLTLAASTFHKAVGVAACPAYEHAEQDELLHAPRER